MATGPESIDKFAGVTGEAQSQVLRVSREGMGTPDDLWPVAGAGGGKNSKHVWPHHLIYLMIGTALARPVSLAPSIGRAFMKLPVSDDEHEYNVTPAVKEIIAWKQEIGAPFPASARLGQHAVSADSAWRLLPGGSVVEALTGLLDRLSKPSGARLLRHLEKGQGITVDLITSENHYRPGVRISLHDPSNSDRKWHNLTTYVEADSAELLAQQSGKAFIQRSALIQFPVLKTMADLWADTQRKTGASLKSPSSEVSGGGEGEDAEATPATSASSRRLSSRNPNQETAGAPLPGRFRGHEKPGPDGRAHIT